MEDDRWMEDFIIPDVSAHNPETEWQLQTTQSPPSLGTFSSNRLDETSLLRTGASFDVESHGGQPWMDNYRQSLGEMEFERENTMHHLSTASNYQENGFFQAGDVPASLAANNGIRNFDHPEMRFGTADGWQSASDHQTPLPTFSIQYDEWTLSDRQHSNVGEDSTDLYANATYGQGGQEGYGPAIQYLAGNAYGLLGEHRQNAGPVAANVPPSHEANRPDQSGINYAYSAPWNPLELRDASNMAASCPAHNYNGSSSHVTAATYCSCSLPSNNETMATTSRSAYTGMWDSLDTVQNAVSADAIGQFPQPQTSRLGDIQLAVYDDGGGLRAPEVHDRGSRHTETASQYSSAISPASITPSHDSGTWYCPYDGCPAKFSGRYGRGNWNRHKRQKHTESGSQEYPCTINGCGKIYLRPDARLKHYRNRHADALETGPPRTRRGSSHDDNSLE